MSRIDRPRFRLAVATLFLVVVVGFEYVQEIAWANGSSPSDSLGPLPILLVATCFPLAGFLIGRWWVIPLAFLPVLLVVPLGASQIDSDGEAVWFLMLSATILFAAPVTAAALLARLAVDWIRRGRAVTGPARS
jgi:hypothetical protein